MQTLPPTETLKLRLRERENFWTSRTELIPCYLVPVMFTLLSSLFIWTVKPTDVK